MSDDEAQYRPSFGGGLGFRPPSLRNDHSDDEEPQRPSLGGGMSFHPPTGFTPGTTPQGQEDDDAPPAKKMKFSKSMGGASGFAGQRGQAPSATSAAAGGSSFAARMMAKMGYKEGEGLGADGRGRLAPIDAQLRPQGAGLGAVREKTKQAKEEEKRAAKLRGEELEDSEEEERKRKIEAKKKRREQAMSGIGSGQRKAKTRYRTAAEIETESAGLEVPNVLKSLVDLSGREAQFAGAGVMVPQETEEGKIAKRARRDLEAFADEWGVLREKKTYAEMESEQLVTELDDQAQDRAHIEELVKAIESLQALSLQGGTTEVSADDWEAVTTKLEALEIRFKDDWGQFGMHEVAVAAIQPPFKLSMLNWEPLNQPEYLVGYLSRLQFMLGAFPNPSKADAVTLRKEEYIPLRPNKKSTTHYETMIYTLWLPQIRTAITNEWQVEQPEALETLLKSWRPLLPEFVLTHVVTQLLVPRLKAALAAWKPGKDGATAKGRTAAPPHHWLFPWLELLPQSQFDSDAPDGLATELRRKVRSLLSNHDIPSGPPSWLSPLRSPLFSEPAFAKLTTNHLLPRLAAYLDANFSIDPSAQQIEPLDNVLSFQSIFKRETFAELLVAGFFPKFHSVLHMWLTADPNYDEIREWFSWWQEQIPESLQELPRVTRQWDAALEMISVAMDLGDRAKTDLPQIGSFLGEEGKSRKESRRKRDKKSKHRNARDKKAEKPRIDIEEKELTFRDVVEEHCSNLGLLFMPMREAHPSNGAPLIRITANASGKGGIVCFIHGDLLYKRSKKFDDAAGTETTDWKPIDWQRELMAMAG